MLASGFAALKILACSIKNFGKCLNWFIIPDVIDREISINTCIYVPMGTALIEGELREAVNLLLNQSYNIL